MGEAFEGADKIIEKRRFSGGQLAERLRYFEEMSRQGKHLWAMEKGGQFAFRQAQSIEYRYRCCYREADGRELEEFLVPYDEAGWEYVCAQSGLWGGRWLYFRKVAPTPEQLALFDDAGNQAAYYRQVRDIWLLIGLPVLLLCLPGQFKFEAYTPLDFLRLGVCGLAALLCGGQALRMTLRIKKLKDTE